MGTAGRGVWQVAARVRGSGLRRTTSCAGGFCIALERMGRGRGWDMCRKYDYVFMHDLPCVAYPLTALMY